MARARGQTKSAVGESPVAEASDADPGVPEVVAAPVTPVVPAAPLVPLPATPEPMAPREPVVEPRPVPSLDASPPPSEAVAERTLPPARVAVEEIRLVPSDVPSVPSLATEESSENLPFGRFLIHARKARGLTLDDVAHQTKIRRAILEAVEGDARRDLPEKVFVLGYVRSYAAAVGLPVEEAVRRFQSSWTDELEAQADAEAAKSGPSLAWVPPTIAALVAAGVLWIIVHF